MDDTEFLSPAQVAEILGLNAEYVRQLIRGGRIRARKSVHGHRWLVPRAEVDGLRDPGSVARAQLAGLTEIVSRVRAADPELAPVLGRLFPALDPETIARLLAPKVSDAAIDPLKSRLKQILGTRRSGT